MAKKVFVWRGFGDIEVYDEDNEKLFEEIKSSLDYELAEIPDNPTWQDLLELVENEIQCGSDSFQYGTGFYTIKESRYG